MARYKDYSYNQTTMMPIRFEKQIKPGTFEYAPNYLAGNELDLSAFATKYRNDATGAPACFRDLFWIPVNGLYFNLGGIKCEVICYVYYCQA